MPNKDKPLVTIHESTRQKLNDLRKALLHLHKILLEIERRIYEQAHGRVAAGELLKLLLRDGQFAWLRELSAIIVRVDELLDADEQIEEDNARLLLTQVKALLVPSETGNSFEKKYFTVLQSDPSAILAHRAVMNILC